MRFFIVSVAFCVRFRAENTPKILFWFTLEALVQTKATKVCDLNFNAFSEQPFYEKVTQGPQQDRQKKGRLQGAVALGLW